MTEDSPTITDMDSTLAFQIQSVSVSGTNFEMLSTTWSKMRAIMSFECSREIIERPDHVFLERNPAAFQCILQYHQGGQLHMPSEMCPSIFQREMEFWGLKKSALSKCCLVKYIGYFDDQAVLKVYFALNAILVLVSLFALIAGTHPVFQRELNLDEWKEYYGAEWDKYRHLFDDTAPEPESEGSELEPLPEGSMTRYTALDITEYVCVALFSIDLIIRCIFCPNRIRLLFYSFLHWVDVFALLVMYIQYLFEYIYPREKYEASFLDVLHCMQIIRVLRLFRLVKHSTGFLVLLYAFKASYREMLLMVMFLLVAMMIFSTMAFFSGDDTFSTIPDSFWWAIVTMTTVGYGDVVPKEALSKLVGVLCAISGVCLLAVIIPIFVNNFMLFYSYSKIWGQMEKVDDTKIKPILQ
ncbi:potassium voltage-gated channel protein egl-36-like [Mya arenaria]|uniref:potassium voltage-gated channel protein egl-36-like n=1 Tax=Mya arenaria TaxID=6604 RepID=UPI0022E3B9B5|nr:potassium voltage-gated channel protein egl-36-like [Mya arenaria]